MAQVVKVKASSHTLKYDNPKSIKTDREAESHVYQYLTSKQKSLLLELILAGGKPSRIRFLFGLVGVSGYPVEAMLRLYHPRYLSRFGSRRV